MKKVLFVCLGNICRSPMAQSVLVHLAQSRGLAGQLAVDSAATGAEELGNPVHPGTRRMLAQQGVPCIPHRARQVTRADYASFDLILGMDEYNLRALRRLFPQDTGKLGLLMDYASRPRPIADPWYTGDFSAAYADISEGCAALLDTLFPGAAGR